MDLSRYQVDHLLLLLGKNPLPNAIAGKLLVKPGGFITLFYTEETSRAIGRLKDFLHEVKFNAHRKIKEADAHSIYEVVYSALDSSEGKSVGLHYTGGTKAMSVHAYAAVRKWRDERGHLAPVFSYLDARTLELVIDPDDPVSSQITTNYIGDLDIICFDELISLHGWSYHKNPRKEPLLPKLAAALAVAHADPIAIDAWRKWKAENIQSGWIWPLPTAHELGSIRTAMLEDLCCSTDSIEAEKSATRLGIEDQKLRLWLNGGAWLEHHVLQCLIDLSSPPENLKLRDCRQEIRIAVPGATDFELDVAALHGYQLFAFSCAKHSKLTDKTELKLKLFEVFVRARQLGGDEARIALVCAHPEPDALQAEIHSEFDSEGRVRVFGQRDLKDLKAALACWIKKQSHTL